MDLKLTIQSTKAIRVDQAIKIPGSKSESNRLLILQALFPEIEIDNLSNSDDTQLLKKALSSSENVIDSGHAGTAMRFLTAYFAIQNGKEIVLTGSERMQQRPVKPLVDALNALGANITYRNQNGFPPLKIIGKELTKNKVHIDATISSQYISALLLITPILKKGLHITWTNSPTSRPYLLMTIELLKKLGVDIRTNDQAIVIKPFDKQVNKTRFKVDPDWSSASYLYSIVALSPLHTSLNLNKFKKDSLQGDSAVVAIYKKFGVDTTFGDGYVQLKKVKTVSIKHIEFNLNNTPDLAQTVAVTCLGLHISCTLSGLHTLKIKETDRLEALKNELQKFGAHVTTTASEIVINPKKINSLATPITIKTYLDHRMAMAFSPLAVLQPISIEDAGVVSKSFPGFWKELQKTGIEVKQQ